MIRVARAGRATTDGVWPDARYQRWYDRKHAKRHALATYTTHDALMKKGHV
jgi:hypothetical protein